MTLNNRLIIMLLSVLVSSRRSCGVLAFQLSRRPAPAISSRICRYAHSTDYSNMKVSDLRELLRERGLAVSGIKAELVDRLISDEGASSRNNRSQVLDDETDELEGLVDHLKSSREEQSLPGNIIFADDDTEEDDPWDNDEDFDPKETIGADLPYERNEKKKTKKEQRLNINKGTSVKDDFQTTRVFVQNIPKECTSWKDLKDHFKVAGEVVYASISVDSRTGESKQCGIVQFATPDMAKTAIRIMRDHPMDGQKLFVREDVQEKRNPREGRAGSNSKMYADDGYNTQLPSEWKRANDEDLDGSGAEWYNLSSDELSEIETIIQKRDKQRRMKNYKMSDKLRDELKEEFGVHLDDRLKLWWTDTKHGGAPALVSDIKGEGRWGKRQPWRQIPTSPESDALVDSELVMSLLEKRDKARRMKDFHTADALLERAHNAPQGGLGLRIHDESRTWRIWTTDKPTSKRNGELTAAELCLQIVSDNEPEKIDEMKALLSKFPGREWNILKKLKSRYGDT